MNNLNASIKVYRKMNLERSSYVQLELTPEFQDNRIVGLYDHYLEARIRFSNWISVEEEPVINDNENQILMAGEEVIAGIESFRFPAIMV